MSASLVWRPEQAGKRVSGDDFRLRKALEYRSGQTNQYTMNRSDVQFLRGLEAAEVNGASELIEAIEKFGTIVIEWRY